MKRVLLILVALVFLLHVGTISADAEEEQRTFNIIYTCSLKESSITYNEIKKQIPSLTSISEIYGSCRVKVITSYETLEIPLSYKENKGYATIKVSFPLSVEKDTISLTFISAVEDGIVVFSEPTNRVSFTNTSSEISASQTLDWSEGMIKLFESEDSKNFFEEAFNKLSESIIEGIQKIFSANDSSDFVTKIEAIFNSFKVFSVSTNFLLSDDVLGAEETGSIIQKIYDLVYPTAFLLMCIIWLFSIAKSCVSTDLWNKESFVKPLIRLVWSVGIMTVSMPLLELIFTVFHRLALEAATATGLEMLGNGGFLESIIDDLADCVDLTPIFGKVNTMKNVLNLVAHNAPTFLLNIIFGLILYVIISIRYIKLATLQCISPFFFACAGSEKADRYLHSFLKEYIILAAQIFIAIIMYAFISILNDAMKGAYIGSLSTAISVLVYLAGMICVCGSGKFLRNLFN